MSQSDIHSYLTEIGRHPVLSKEAQLRHCQRIQEWVNHEGGRDKAPRCVYRAGKRALDVMTRTNARLVVSIARRYQNRGLDLADLIQEGNLGLIRGLELFDPTRGYAVTTYCYWWIRQSITRAIHTHARSIRLPINTHELIIRIQRYSTEYVMYHGHAPTFAEIAEYVEVRPSRIAQVLQAHTLSNCVSLDHICIEGGDALVDMIPTPTTGNGSVPENELMTNLYREILQKGIALLSPSEAQVVEGVFFNNRTLKDIADEQGFSRSRAGQLQRSAFNKLRLLLAPHANDI